MDLYILVGKVDDLLIANKMSLWWYYFGVPFLKSNMPYNPLFSEGTKKAERGSIHQNIP